MLIRFFNPNDLIGCCGDINKLDSFMYMKGVHGEVRGGDMWRGYVERVCRGGAQRGYTEGYAKGYAGDMQRGYVQGVHRGGT